MQLTEGNYGFHFLDGSFAPCIVLQSVGLESRVDSSYYFENAHRSEFYLFQYTLSGTGTVEIDDQPRTLSAGQAFFLRVPGPEKYYFDPARNQAPWRFIYIIFSGEAAAPLYERIYEARGPILSLCDHDACIQSLFSLYRDAQSGAISDVFAGSSLAYGFLCALCSRMLALPSAPPGLSLRARQLMETQYANLDGIEDLACRLNVTPSHLSRVFAHEMGMTPIAFLTRKRLEHAVELVYTHSLTNDEIARRCGFANGNYLCKLFRRYLGASPHALRAQPYPVAYTRVTLY